MFSVKILSNLGSIQAHLPKTNLKPRRIMKCFRQCILIVEGDPDWEDGSAQLFCTRIFRKLNENGSSELAMQMRKKLFLVQGAPEAPVQ